MNFLYIVRSRYFARCLGKQSFAEPGIGASLALFMAFFMAIFLGNFANPNVAEARISNDDRLIGQFSYCSGSNRQNCIVDGDTFWFRGQKIRIADINTPELGGARCDHERRMGEQAKERLRSLLNKGPFSLVSIKRDTDRYGRALRVVKRGGRSLGQTLVDEGLAEEWNGYRRDWC